MENYLLFGEAVFSVQIHEDVSGDPVKNDEWGSQGATDNIDSQGFMYATQDTVDYTSWRAHLTNMQLAYLDSY